MSFNTAIFYDIENLIKGYGFSTQTITNVSLKEILTALRQTGKIGHIAVQRAYANWSDPRLGVMRDEINEPGIDPIQVFGFAREPKRNAADVQLAIDAIDLAYIRPGLNVFVIVSGDGGFAALAKKLHEYGKTVIGCAYRSAVNKTFQAVCDEFVWITDPEEKVQPVHALGQIGVTDSRNIRLAEQVAKVPEPTPENTVAKTREILDWYVQNTTTSVDLVQKGITLSVIKESVMYAIPDFQPGRLGFAKFIEYMQFVCQGTNDCIVRLPTSHVVLALRRAVPDGVRCCQIWMHTEWSAVETRRGAP